MASSRQRRRATASNPETQETRMIGYAMELAEKQLIEGTASPSVITHFLKMGSMRERLEKEKLEKENTLLKAKAEAIESSKRSEELFAEAMKAFSSYSGAFLRDNYSDDEEWSDDEDE